MRGGREGGAEEWGSGKELKINVYIPISLIFSYEKLLRIRRITCVHAKISNCKYTTNFFNRITEYFQLSLFIGSVFFGTLGLAVKSFSGTTKILSSSPVKHHIFR